MLRRESSSRMWIDGLGVPLSKGRVFPWPDGTSQEWGVQWSWESRLGPLVLPSLLTGWGSVPARGRWGWGSVWDDILLQMRMYDAMMKSRHRRKHTSMNVLYAWVVREAIPEIVIRI